MLPSFLVCAVLLASSCIRYHPQPIQPAKILADYEARRLDSAELKNYLLTKAVVKDWPPRTWDFGSLTLAAFYYSPDLDIARAQWSVSRAGRVTAGERPNPAISGILGYNRTTPVSEITPWIPEASLEIPVETAGKRGYRILEARHLSEAARLNILSAAWDVRGRLRQAFLNHYAAQEREALLKKLEAFQEESVRILDAQVQVGEAAAYQLAQARIALDNGRLAALDAVTARTAARTGLAQTIGLPTAALDGVPLAFDEFASLTLKLPPNEIQRRALISRSDILGALSEYEAAQAALRVEIAKQYPDLVLGPDYQLDQTDVKWTLGLSLILPLLNRNKGPIAEAEARRAEVAARFLALQASVLAELERASAAGRAAGDKARAADEMLTELRRQEAAGQARYKAGEISKLELLAIQLEVSSGALARLEALVQAQQAVGDLEKAIQAPLDIKAWVLETPARTAGRVKEHKDE
ncbi:MAG: TolC family protein [Candidatus Aminicenantes bacterium]|nr:TolC family protein [Candidatus Aminicenantes bacterium]